MPRDLLLTNQNGYTVQGIYECIFSIVADLLTVNETAVETPQDEGNHMNSPRNLALEATFINHNFSQQCLKKVGFALLKSTGLDFTKSERERYLRIKPKFRNWYLTDLQTLEICQH